MKQHSIASRFISDDGDRQTSLDRARICATLTDPTILPLDSLSPTMNSDTDRVLAQSYQSDGAYGLLNMGGRLLLALFGQQWFQLSLAPELWYSPEIGDEQKQAADQRLFLWELIATATLQATGIGIDSTGHRHPTGFLSRKHAAIMQLLATGDVLEQLTDDYGLRVFRRDQYVTARDSAGQVLYHIVKERIDPYSLTQEQRAKSELNTIELEQASPKDRVKDIYTLVEWQPFTKRWLIQLECNGKTIDEHEERISSYFSTPFKLAGGENYGRGFVETAVFGDLVSLNELEYRRLALLSMASKQIVAKDPSSLARDSDLTKPPGSIITARVSAGVVQDIGTVSFASPTDYNMLVNGIEHKSMAVRRAFLVESSVQPTGDRVTSAAIQRVAQEIEGALGGSYVPIADFQQIPLLQRTIHQLKRDKKLPPMPEGSVHVSSLTGLAAISRAGEANRLLNFTQTIAALGPEAVSRLNMGALIAAYQRLSAIYQPGLVKTDQQLQQEAQQAMRQQLTVAAGEQAVETVGNVVEQQAAGSTTP